MDTPETFTLELSSAYAEWWRYNVTILCGCFDADDRRVDFAAAEDTVAPVGSELRMPPEGYAPDRRVTVRAAACDHLVAYIYIVPHTLPVTREIGAVSPFDVELRFTSPDGASQTTHYRVNQWSGASIELKRSGR